MLKMMLESALHIDKNGMAWMSDYFETYYEIK